MSPEQYAAPTAAQLDNHLNSGIDKGYDENKSDLERIEVIRARQDIIKAIGGPSLAVASEALQSHIEKKRLTPQEQIHAIGQHVVGMRAGYDEAHLNLHEDEEKLNQGMFDLAA